MELAPAVDAIQDRAPAPTEGAEIEVIEPGAVPETEVASGGLVRRLTPAAAEAGPVVNRFAEMQAACSCASGCPTCIVVTAGSFALPFIFRGRRGQEEPDESHSHEEHI